MYNQKRLSFALVACLCLFHSASADPPRADTGPEPVPLTRDAMKRALDASKETTPRLPLPPLTPEEVALIEEQQAKAAQAGEKPRRLGLANNGRMRAYYLADYGFKNDIERARAGTNRDSESRLEPALRTSMFWIVSRGNNCTYCLGHQESGLASRGMTDDQLASLDGDWQEFDAARQAAFAFASKLSFEPYAMTDRDVERLRQHFDEAQVAEIIATVAGFNATNRWTGPLRIRQDVLFQYTRPTSEKYASLVSRVAPAENAPAGAQTAAPRARPRPPLESRAEVAAALEQARRRVPRIPLAEPSAAEVLAGSFVAGGNPPQWVRLLSVLGKSGGERIASYRAVFEKGSLDPRTKALIAYVGARQDRAWYALGHAIARLRALGFTEDQVFELDQPEALPASADREVVRFARQITLDPALITDEDFARVRAHFDDRKTAEIVYQITQAAFFDRLTEAAGLPLEQ